jgi:hypothetical protein
MHWKAHRVHCKSPLRKESWQPRWAIENRQPTWLVVDDNEADNIRKATADKYLWGNMSALDVLQLGSNEGETFSEDIKLLLAGQYADPAFQRLSTHIKTASGDARNVVKTFADLPRTYNGTLSITMNDHDPHIVARNIIICVLAASVENAAEASESIIHIWYSAFIRQADLDLLTTHVLPLVQEVCSKIKEKSSASLHSKKWKIKNCSLRLVMSKMAWELLLSCLTVRPGLTLQQAQALRLAVTNGHDHRDDRDRVAVRQSPAHRVSKQKHNEDGLILPFGHSTQAFVIPNP